MSAFFFFEIFIILIMVAAPVPATVSSYINGNPGRIRINFNSGWKFLLKDIDHGDAVSLNEKGFKTVVLPHTITLLPHRAIDTSSMAHISWYRKRFTVPEKYRHKRILIEFEAVSKAADVFLNGKFVGSHKGAYTPFAFDVSKNVLFGKENVLAVRVDSRQRKDIPPEGKDVDYIIGGGIVRDVWLIITNRLYVDWVYVRNDTDGIECVELTAKICNEETAGKSGKICFILADAAQNIVAQSVLPFSLASGECAEIKSLLGPVGNIQRWHPDHPYLYTLQSQILECDSVIDNINLRIGVRSVEFRNNDGRFYINNKPLRLFGVNRHETFPFIGRAAANRLQRKDADIIKYQFGCNIVRCSHYPQDPAFLDRCDEIGLLVLEEMEGWNFVHHDKEWRSVALENLKAMIMRDRNHPSVISFGVRINQSADFNDFYRETNRIAKTLDPGRPTHGVRVLGRGYKDGFLEDVWAQNFFIPSAMPPFLPWITTECVGHNLPTHSWDNGERLLRQLLAHASAHDSAAANPYIAGCIGWCAFDYHSPYIYSEESVCYHGIADMFRIPKHAAFFYRSQSNPAIYGPMVYIAHYWDVAMEPNDVWVASNCDSVEIFVNDSSIGKKAPCEDLSLSHPLFVWRNIPFVPGEIRAVGYIGKEPAATFTRKTPGKAVGLRMIADDTVLTTGGDMTRIVITAIDKNGQIVPRNCAAVKISVKGPAVFLGEKMITLEDGKTAFFIQTSSDKTGKVVCIAESAGLRAAKAIINILPAGDMP